MKIYPLTREEGNALHKDVVELGLDPFDFEWSESDPRYDEYVEWKHKPTGYVFRFSGFESDSRLYYLSKWTPVVNGRAAGEFQSSRAAQLQAAVAWLRAVKREHDTPDLWARVREEQELLAGDAFEGDRSFTPKEQKLLSERLDQLQIRIVQIASPDTTQAAALTNTIDTLKTAATKSTRSEWKLMFTGAIISTMLNLALDPVRMQQVVQAATNFIGPLIAHIRGLIG
jgi:hypothetical protein